MQKLIVGKNVCISKLHFSKMNITALLGKKTLLGNWPLVLAYICFPKFISVYWTLSFPFYWYMQFIFPVKCNFSFLPFIHSFQRHLLNIYYAAGIFPRYQFSPDTLCSFTALDLFVLPEYLSLCSLRYFSSSFYNQYRCHLYCFLYSSCIQLWSSVLV